MLKDPYGRPLTSLRISITQRCNLNCFYCHREGESYQASTEMTPEEVRRIVELAASLGFRHVKLTGGEPLLREDILNIVRRIRGVRGIEEVSMTTNGILLYKLAEPLKKAGLDRVNVSLDTLRREVYKAVTGWDLLDSVVLGVRRAVEAGLSPVKLNMVLLKGFNDGELWDMISFAAKNKVILQLIELEPLIDEEVYEKHHMELTPLEGALKKMAKEVMVRSMQHRRRYILANGAEVEVVKPVHNTEFCMNCTKLRVTSDGKLKPCLMSPNNLIDILTPLRLGARNKELANLFIKAAKLRKPYYHQSRNICLETMANDIKIDKI